MATEARQLGLKYLEAAKNAEVESTRLLENARDANKAFALNQSSSSAARRSVIAQQAYTHRMNATAGRFMATYALMAAQEGEKAVSAKVVAQKAGLTTAERTTILEGAKHAERRESLLMQASAVAKEQLKNVPGLPGYLIGKVAGTAQVPVTGSNVWRSSFDLDRTGLFFPDSIREAAGSFNGVGLQDGLNWLGEVEARMETDNAALRNLIKGAAGQVLNQDPATAGIGQQAENLADGLFAKVAKQHASESVNGPPWLHITAALLAGAIAVKLFFK